MTDDLTSPEPEPLPLDPTLRISALEERLAKLKRREGRNLRQARAYGFLDGVRALLQPGDLAIDCGANVGEVTALLAATGAHVISFEPDPYAFAELTKRFADTPNVTLLQQAVSTQAGTLTLRRAANFDDNPKGGSVKSTLLSGGRGVNEAGGIAVDVIDFVAYLRALIAEHGTIAFIKMGIEGAELDLLQAMDSADLFASVRCIVAETHENKFKYLRPRFRALRENFGEKYAAHRVNLDWI